MLSVVYARQITRGKVNTVKKLGMSLFHSNTDINIKWLHKFATSRNLIVKSTKCLHRNIHKYTWTSPDGITHNQIDHVLVDKRRQSSIIDVRSLGEVDCDTDHSLVVETI